MNLAYRCVALRGVAWRCRNEFVVSSVQPRWSSSPVGLFCTSARSGMRRWPRFDLIKGAAAGGAVAAHATSAISVRTSLELVSHARRAACHPRQKKKKKCVGGKGGSVATHESYCNLSQTPARWYRLSQDPAGVLSDSTKKHRERKVRRKTKGASLPRTDRFVFSQTAYRVTSNV